MRVRPQYFKAIAVASWCGEREFRRARARARVRARARLVLLVDAHARVHDYMIATAFGVVAVQTRRLHRLWKQRQVREVLTVHHAAQLRVAHLLRHMIAPVPVETRLLHKTSRVQDVAKTWTRRRMAQGSSSRAAWGWAQHVVPHPPYPRARRLLCGGMHLLEDVTLLRFDQLPPLLLRPSSPPRIWER